MSFSELGICPEILEAIEVLGFETPSPIQERAIPPALEGADILGLSHTGSGKTLAFSIPALENIDPTLRTVQVLCLALTRNHCAIHDLIAGTVVVDKESQTIFRTTEDLIAWQKKVAAERAARAPY